MLQGVTALRRLVSHAKGFGEPGLLFAVAVCVIMVVVVAASGIGNGSPLAFQRALAGATFGVGWGKLAVALFKPSVRTEDRGFTRLQYVLDGIAWTALAGTLTIQYGSFGAVSWLPVLAVGFAVVIPLWRLGPRKLTQEPSNVDPVDPAGT